MSIDPSLSLRRLDPGTSGSAGPTPAERVDPRSPAGQQKLRTLNALLERAAVPSSDTTPPGRFAAMYAQLPPAAIGLIRELGLLGENHALLEAAARAATRRPEVARLLVQVAHLKAVESAFGAVMAARAQAVQTLAQQVRQWRALLASTDPRDIPRVHELARQLHTTAGDNLINFFPSSFRDVYRMQAALIGGVGRRPMCGPLSPAAEKQLREGLETVLGTVESKLRAEAQDLARAPYRQTDLLDPSTARAVGRELGARIEWRDGRPQLAPGAGQGTPLERDLLASMAGARTQQRLGGVVGFVAKVVVQAGAGVLGGPVAAGAAAVLLNELGHASEAGRNERRAALALAQGQAGEVRAAAREADQLATKRAIGDLAGVAFPAGGYALHTGLHVSKVAAAGAQAAAGAAKEGLPLAAQQFAAKAAEEATERGLEHAATRGGALAFQAGEVLLKEATKKGLKQVLIPHEKEGGR
jgi:hypothetical protein